MEQSNPDKTPRNIAVSPDQTSGIIEDKSESVEVIGCTPMTVPNNDAESTGKADSEEAVPAEAVEAAEVAEGAETEAASQVVGEESAMSTDQVSSTTESAGPGKTNLLPSINHQSVLIPNMEPYLEEGSLDGSDRKEFPEPAESADAAQVELTEEQADMASQTVSQQSEDDAPVNHASELEPALEEEESGEGTADDGGNIVESHLEPYIEDEPVTENGGCSSTDPNSLAADVSVTETNQTEAGEANSDSAATSVEPEKYETVNTIIFKTEAMATDEATCNADMIAPSAVQDAAPTASKVEEEVVVAEPFVAQQECPAVSATQDAVSDCKVSDEPVTQSMPAIYAETEGSDVKQEIYNEIVMNNICQESYMEQHQTVDPCKSEAEMEEEEEEDQHHHHQQPVSQMEEQCHKDDQQDLVSQYEELRQQYAEAADQEGEHQQQQAVQEGDDGSSILPHHHQQEQEQQMISEANATVCEADSSITYVVDGNQVDMSSQNVHYVVDDSLMPISRADGSMTMSYSHEEAEDATMLVEMAPMSTDGSYSVSTHSQVICHFIAAFFWFLVCFFVIQISCVIIEQVGFVSEASHQGGMHSISDAQAAELLTRFSEQRPLGASTASSNQPVPYVQVQLAQTVEGITHLVQVPVSALSYLPTTTLMYTSPENSASGSQQQMTTWVVEAPANADHHHLQSHHQAHIQGSDNRFADIVSASIEAIGFPESTDSEQTGQAILAQAEHI